MNTTRRWLSKGKNRLQPWYTPAAMWLRRRLQDQNLLGNRYLHRSTVFIIDLALVALSMLVIYFALYSLDLKKYTLEEYALLFSVQVGAYALFFYAFHIYQGVVRHSTFYDLINIFLASTCAFGLLNVVNLIFTINSGQPLFIFQVIFVNYLAIMLTLVFFRILVKYIFDRLMGAHRKSEAHKVLIVGTDSMSVSLAQALIAERPLRFEPMGFLSNSGEGQTKRILNRIIYTPSAIHLKALKEEGLTGVIINTEQLSFGELDRLTDLCLETNLRIYKFGLLDNKKVPAKPSQSIEQFRIEDLLGRDPIKITNEANFKEFRGRRVMVTGAAGSIGSEIVRQLLVYQPKEIVLVDHAETPLADLRLELEDKDIHSDIIYRIEDVRRLKAMESVFERHKPEFVFHAAAYKHVPIMEAQPEQAVENNIAGTAIVADLSMKYGVKKFVFISTDKAVNPANVMGASKRIAERYIQCLQALTKGKSSTQFITTRFGNVLGSNGSVIPIFARQIANGGPVTITHPDIIRYFMTIPEACQLVVEACTMGQGGQIMIFDMGKPVKILELARKMIHLAGFTPGVDIGIEYTGLRPGEKMYEELVNEVSCVQPSHHPKIMILEDPEIEAGSLVMHQIRSLIEKAPERTPAALVRGMKKLVPEFISANSTYEKFDTPDPLQVNVTH